MQPEDGAHANRLACGALQLRKTVQDEYEVRLAKPPSIFEQRTVIARELLSLETVQRVGGCQQGRDDDRDKMCIHMESP